MDKLFPRLCRRSWKVHIWISSAGTFFLRIWKCIWTSLLGTKLNSSRRLSFILVRQTKQKLTPTKCDSAIVLLLIFQLRSNLPGLSLYNSFSTLQCWDGQWTLSKKLPPYLCLENGCRDSGVCMRVYLWIGKISWRFHKHTILQISLKIWAAGLRVIPKNGETKSFSNRANSQRNTNTHSLHKIWPVLESWFPTKTFSKIKKKLQKGDHAGKFWNNHS